MFRGHGKRLGACAVAAALMAAGPAGSVPAAAGSAARCPLPVFGPGSAYQPVIRPSSFTANVSNQWFPLRPGRVLVYAGTKDGKRALDILAPSARTKVIDGVRTRMVEDRLLLNDVLEERTTDYYAQDACGNVWYFGEDTAELDKNGHVVNTSGSFHAGVNGAQPGVFMQDPQLGRWFRQEWYRGQAEDTFRVVQFDDGRRPYGTFHGDADGGTDRAGAGRARQQVLRPRPGRGVSRHRSGSGRDTEARRCDLLRGMKRRAVLKGRATAPLCPPVHPRGSACGFWSSRTRRRSRVCWNEA